jgi:lipopolysaccharide export system permease protein
MTKTIDRYVAREFIRVFLIFICAVPLLFILGDWTDNIGQYTERGIPFTRVALSYIYQLPLFISWSFPVGALIATVFTVSTMTRHSEMTAAKAGGISFFRVLRVLPLIGVFLTLAGLALTEVVPVTTAMTREVLGEVQVASGDMRHEFVYSGPDGHVFTVRRMSMGGPHAPPTLGGITIEHPGGGDVTPIHVSARNGRYDEATGWTLEDGYYRTFRGDSAKEQSYRFQSMRLAAFTERPEELMARAKDPEEMRYEELGAFIETLERSGANPGDLHVKRAQKISIPAATLIIILFGAPLANTSPRGGAAYGIGVSLGITVIYMMMFRVTGAAGTSGMMDPMHAAWLPNVVFAVAALVLLGRVRT